MAMARQLHRRTAARFQLTQQQLGFQRAGGGDMGVAEIYWTLYWGPVYKGIRVFGV